MSKVFERLTEALRSIERSEVMQRLLRAQQSFQKNKIVRELALAPKSPGRRLFTAFLIAIAAATVALLAACLPPFAASITNINEAFYDSLYQRRTPESCKDAKVVMVSVDDWSIDTAFQETHQDWPWPRYVWGNMIEWLEKSGAKVVVFDMLFENASEDDAGLIRTLDTCKIPVIIAEPGATRRHGEVRAQSDSATNIWRSEPG